MSITRSVEDLPPPPAPGEVMRGRACTSPPDWQRALIRLLAWGHVLGAVPLWAVGGGVAQLAAPDGLLDSMAMLLGLLATGFALVALALMARTPWVERSFGHAELVRCHRLVGAGLILVVLAHVLLVAFAYPDAGPVQIVTDLVRFMWQEPTVALAALSTALLLAVAVTSTPPLRQHLAYERWHLIHMVVYVAILAAIPHQLVLGDALQQPWARSYLLLAVLTVYANVMVFRVVVPLAQSWYYRPVVGEVVRESREVVSITIHGRRRDLSGLGFQVGQFAVWRFLDGPGWTRGHPFSISAAPGPNELRITVKAVDGSSRWISMPVGTPVIIEGPYGRLTETVRTRWKVLLMAAGTGITPIRALLQGLEDLEVPTRGILIYRVSHETELLFRAEIDALAAARGIQVHYLIGSRGQRRDSWLPAILQHLSDFNALLQLVPDLTDRDLFVCGPDEWMQAVERAARRAELPPSQIHVERLSW